MGEGQKEVKEKTRMTFDEMREKMNPQTKDSLKAASGLGIKGIPYNQKIRFMEIAKESFRGDWGITLGYMVNYYDDTQVILGTLQKVMVLEKKLDALLYQKEDTQTKGSVKLINGVEVPRK